MRPAVSTPGRPGGRGPQAGVGWRTIDVHPGYLSSYYFSPEDITTAALHQMWSLRTDHVVQTLAIRKLRHTQPDGGGPVVVSALVRTNDPQQPQQPPTLFLNPLPGDQYAAALWAAPIARPRLALPTRVLDDPDGLEIPIGADRDPGRRRAARRPQRRARRFSATTW